MSELRSEPRNVIAWLASGALEDAFRTAIHEEVRDAVREVYAEEMGQQSVTGTDDGSSGITVGRLLLVGTVALLVAYVVRSQSGSEEGIVETASNKLQRTTGETAGRTERMTGETADRVRERGQEVSERTEEMSEAAAGSIQQTGETVSERIDEGSSQVADSVEETGSEAADSVEETGSEAADSVESATDRDEQDDESGQ